MAAATARRSSVERLESRGYSDDGRGIAVRAESAEGNPLAHDLSGVFVGGWLARGVKSDGGIPWRR